MVTFPGGDGWTLHATGPGWMPEHLEETLRTWLSDGFKVIMEKRPDLTRVGAKDSRMFLSGQEVDGEIVDCHHATAHLSEASGHADLKRRGWQIGPGHVEVVNKTHVGERMKRSGMRWSMAGGQAIPGMRPLIGSGRCDRSWEYIVEELKRRNPANDNWNHWKEKRRQLD